MPRLIAAMGRLMRRLVSHAGQWCSSTHGGIAVTFAISLPVVLAVLGLASDYAMMTKVRNDLQQAADAAALAGAREIPLANSKTEQVESAVKSFAAFELTNDSDAMANKLTAMNITLNVKVVDNFSAVDVRISEAWTPFFAHFLDSSVTPVNVHSKARFVGRNNVCVLGLAGTNTAVLFGKDARFTGNNCGVFSNSTGSAGLRIDSGVVASASIICSSGGAKLYSSDVKPTPITDCPPVEDPLAQRPMPSVGSCDYKNMALKDVNVTMDPGVYCGGIHIYGSSVVTLNPGIYVMKDGKLKVSGTATLEGKGVGFFITGAAADKIQLQSGSHISLTAPETGSMAGLLFMEDRNLPVILKHQITSDDARVLLGTIYLPVGGLVVDAKQPVADKSAYTAIVAQTIELNDGPNLVLNADYDMTDVPAPAGIAGSSQVILSN